MECLFEKVAHGDMPVSEISMVRENCYIVMKSLIFIVQILSIKFIASYRHRVWNNFFLLLL